MQESQQKQPDIEPVEGESPEPTVSELEQVAQLLSGDEPDDTGDDAGDDAGDSGTDSETVSESEQQGTPKTISELAERLDVDVAELYALEVPFGGDGESRTLGELKDAHISADQLELDRMTFEESKAEKEAELMRNNNQLAELIGMLPKGAITPELVQTIQERHTELTRRESKLTLDAIPEWSDKELEANERAEMAEFLDGYGFPSGYLKQLFDHRMMKLLRDSMKREQRIRHALEQVKTVRKPGHGTKPPATPPKKTPRRKARGGQSSEVQQVAELLANG